MRIFVIRIYQDYTNLEESPYDDYEIAQAWERLMNGNYVDSDIQLLNHEIFESKFEGIFKTDYRTAHDKTIESGRLWNWESNCKE
ncbi:hypothetical protein [Bacillus sp. DX1.1]|uniref:hypothetical protein n=1 Tax=Bacillus sp. DX1.1 TaxID=3055866 RepID=UPI0025A30D34|nr:hypothetical protein [Bacillus sp. DX1.1]